MEEIIEPVRPIPSVSPKMSFVLDGAKKREFDWQSNSEFPKDSVHVSICRQTQVRVNGLIKIIIKIFEQIPIIIVQLGLASKLLVHLREHIIINATFECKLLGNNNDQSIQ